MTKSCNVKIRRFIGDGLISAGLGILLPVGASVLCRPGEMICALFNYVGSFFLRPFEYVELHLNGKIAGAIAAVHPEGFKSPGLQISDYFLIGIGVLEYLMYWFLIGVVICGVWRAARKQFQALWSAPVRQS